MNINVQNDDNQFKTITNHRQTPPPVEPRQQVQPYRSVEEAENDFPFVWIFSLSDETYVEDEHGFSFVWTLSLL